MRVYIGVLGISLICCLTNLAFAQERINARDDFDWQAFDSTSSIHMDSIHYKDLSGIWICDYKIEIGDFDIGIARKDGRLGAMDFKGENYRNALSGPYYTFSLASNRIIFNTTNDPDTAFINKITGRELNFSIRDGIDYVQFFYTK